MQLALNTVDWDIFLDGSGNIATLGEKSIGDLICQRVKHRLQTFQGECFLDRSVGVPYFSEVLKKNPDLRRIRSLLVATISAVPGVDKVLEFSVNFISSTREYKVIFRAETSDGTIVSGEI